MTYPYILLDIDGTLINFMETYKAASAKVLKYGGHSVTDETIRQYYQFNDDVWLGMNLDNVYDPYICRNYHSMYMEYFRISNENARLAMGLKHSTAELSDYFIKELGECALPNTNAVDVCRHLAENHTLCIASNGLTDLQMSKLTDFHPYISHYFISEDMGCIKPEKAYFQIILDSLRCSPSDCLMVGDSLRNDIAGANNSGIISCHYNPMSFTNTSDIKPAYEIRDFSELLNIV